MTKEQILEHLKNTPNPDGFKECMEAYEKSKVVA